MLAQFLAQKPQRIQIIGHWQEIKITELCKNQDVLESFSVKLSKF